MTLLGIIGPQELILILLVALGLFLLPLIAIVDIVRSKFEGNMQLIWILLVIFFNIIGFNSLFFYRTKSEDFQLG